VSAAREQILGDVRAALGAARPAAEPAAGYRRGGSLDPAARVALFAGRVADYRASVTQTNDAAAAVAEIAAGRALAVPPGLRHDWRPPEWVEDDGFTPAELDRLVGVVTGCSVAIAQTGTIVLAGGAEEGRRALTLVPDLHVCVVEASQIVETVPEAFDRLAGLAGRPLTFVSGPSATSDIELKRVEGVHGPRRLFVVIAKDP
jgi:L-lactate dehydrogenase complex protein LldG